jgi:fatty-acyl-CoA synthase
MAPNVPAIFDAHFGVPMIGAVLNAINIRLDAATIAFILDHGEARVLITDRQFSGGENISSTGKIQKFVLRGKAREL